MARLNIDKIYSRNWASDYVVVSVCFAILPEKPTTKSQNTDYESSSTDFDRDILSSLDLLHLLEREIYKIEEKVEFLIQSERLEFADSKANIDIYLGASQCLSCPN